MNYLEEIQSEIATMENKDAAKLLSEKSVKIINSKEILSDEALRKIESEFESFDLSNHDFYRVGTVLSMARRLQK